MAETVPVPWQLWTSSDQGLYRSSLYVLCLGWVCLAAVHLEEVNQ